MYNDDDKSTMMNREIERRRRWRGLEGAEKNGSSMHVRSFHLSLDSPVSFNVQRLRLRFPKSWACTTTLLSSYSRRKSAREEEIGPREYVTTGTVHTIKCKRKKKKRKKKRPAWWLAGWLGWLARRSSSGWLLTISRRVSPSLTRGGCGQSAV